ncbi:MAG: hypothetical protein RL632_2020 [Bacteroidota bacterium]|jgi:hypothetical protein
MIDSAITNAQILLISVLLVYLLVVSIFINRYHNLLKDIQQSLLKLKWNRMSREQVDDAIHLSFQRIKGLKKKSYFTVFILGSAHWLSCLYFDFTWLFAVVPFGLFTFVLFGNFWLKGSAIIGFIKNTPVAGRWHNH